MKAIATFYKNYAFRSRTEARYAVFLDKIGEKWEYEKEGYDLDDGDRYLPDFFLPRLKTFLEVKGEYPNEREIRVARKLQFFTGYDVVIFNGLPLENSGLLFGWTDGNGGMLTEYFVQWAFDGVLTLNDGPGVCSPPLCQAAIAAKQARFEYGHNEKRVVDYGNIPF